MNIAFIHCSFITGGLERITMDIIRYLSGFGDRYHCIIYADRFDQQSEEKLAAMGIPTRVLHSEEEERTADLIRFLKEDKTDIAVESSNRIGQIRKIKEETGILVLHANHGEPFWERYYNNKRRQEPLRGFCQKVRQYTGYPMRTAVRQAKEDYANSEAYVVLCEAYRQQMCKKMGIDPETSHMYAIENPEKAVENPQFEKEKIVLYCGRLKNKAKRIDRLLRIWARVQDRKKDWKLLLLGDGPQREYLEKMAADLHLERIEFCGSVADPTPYYRKASIVCLTSQTEGWPLALTEGQAQGCITIAFGCTAGVREIIGDDSSCGFLIPPFKEKRYAETLIKIMDLPEEKQMEIRKSAVEKRLNYTPEKMAEKWKILFDHLGEQKKC